MNTPHDYEQRYLVTWYHPSEHVLAPETNSWVISRNDDFGYEVACAVITEGSEAAAKALIRKSYPAPPPTIHFRSCKMCLQNEHDATDLVLLAVA